MRIADTQLNLHDRELEGTPMGRSLLDGRLIATVISPIDGTHITVRFSCKRPPVDDERRWQTATFADAKRIYIDVPGTDLSPGDQVGTYDRARGRLWYAGGSGGGGVDPRRVNAAVYVLLSAAGRLEGSKLMGADPEQRERIAKAAEQAIADGGEILESLPCFTCGRPLTDPESIRRGQGPKCYGAATGSQHEHKNAELDAQADVEQVRIDTALLDDQAVEIDVPAFTYDEPEPAPVDEPDPFAAAVEAPR